LDRIAAADSAASAASAALNTPLTGFSVGGNAAVVDTDTILQGFGKTQGQINARVSGTGTAGQVAFWNGTNTQAGDSGLVWDNVNKRLGVGLNNPDVQFQVLSTIRIGKNTVKNEEAYNIWTNTNIIEKKQKSTPESRLYYISLIFFLILLVVVLIILYFYTG
jgi:hypothetical protein